MTIVPNSRPLSLSAFRVRLRALVAALALAVAGTGCVASLGEMRAKPAQRVLVAPGRYGDLGGCVAAGLQEAPAAGFWGFLLKPGDLRLEVVRRDDQQTMTVTAYPGLALDMSAFDLAFRQESDQVRIELREGMTRQAILDDTWVIVERCANQTPRG
jgi:hypothetical protein